MGLTELESKKTENLFLKSFWTALKRTWNQFCMKTSIHGLKFANESSTNCSIRLVWWMITLSCMIASILMVLDFYDDYRSNQTRLMLQNSNAPVASLEFPSITICPETLLNIEKSERYISKLILPAFTLARDIVNKLSIIGGLMNGEDDIYNFKDFNLMEQVLKVNNLSVQQFLYDIKWDCKDILFRCRYKFEIIPCEELFQVQRSFLGYCCSFNISKANISRSIIYGSPGINDGLSVILYRNDSYYENTTVLSPGFRVLIDDDFVFPSVQSITTFVAFNTELFAAVNPVQITCSKAVKALPINERQCALRNEVKLQYFQHYTGPHCALNCRILKSMRFCGCIPYYIAQTDGTERVCSFRDIPCLLSNFGEIIGRNRSTQCTCPNKCETVSYNIRVTGTDLQTNIPNADIFYNGIKNDFCVLHVYMQSQVYRLIIRDLVTSTIMLVSSLGSAFSLFVGMSMVSLVEIIYYATVMLYKNYVKEKKLQKKKIFQKKVCK